jgi:hypothetical protein
VRPGLVSFLLACLVWSLAPACTSEGSSPECKEVCRKHARCTDQKNEQENEKKNEKRNEKRKRAAATGQTAAAGASPGAASEPEGGSDPEGASDPEATEQNKFDQSECIGACMVLRREREGQRLVAQHLACVNRAKDDCAALLACP